MSIDQILNLILTALGSIALFILSDVVSQLRKMSESVSLLNERIAVVVEKLDSHEKRILKLEDL